MSKSTKGFQPGNQAHAKPAEQKAKMVSVRLSPEALAARDKISAITGVKNKTQCIEDALLFYAKHIGK